VPTPPSPGATLIGTSYPLNIQVGLDAPYNGALQVSLVENGSGEIIEQSCQGLEENLDQARTFNMVWTQDAPGNTQYTLWTRYRAQEDCPIQDSHESDISQQYQVNWEEDIPELEVKDMGGSLVSSGDTINLGQKGFFQNFELIYTLFNTSTTSSMKINSIGVENLVNLDGVTVDPSGPVTLGPEEQQLVTVGFQVTEIG
jgi:hypothetical protein